MNWVPFHHPDISLPVLRRRIVEEFLDVLSEFGSGYGSLSVLSQWRSDYPSRPAFNQAMSRLKRKGIIAAKSTGGLHPVLELTEKGKARRPPVLRPQRYWNRRWNRIWYVLVYDVPESNRKYRNSLRRILRDLRMGCLQGSVWVSPNDIRGEYDDLEKAAGVGGYAFLFESRTVLGQSSIDVVQQAWDFDSISQLQGFYCRVLKKNLKRLDEHGAGKAEVLELARKELEAYLSVMNCDPLLPRDLWPSDYMGEEAFNVHGEFAKLARQYL